MYELLIDKSKCRVRCDSCEQIIPGFKTQFDGNLSVSDSNSTDPAIRAKINRIIDCCQSNAITFKKVKHC
jgi:hypothetical protein